MKNKRIISVIVVCALVISVCSFGKSAFAQSEVNSLNINNTTNFDPPVRVTKITQKCGRCGKSIVNYGYDKSVSGGTKTALSGTYCIGCKQIVPEGERHTSLYFHDKYFFMCTCGNTWTSLSDPIVWEHTIQAE